MPPGAQPYGAPPGKQRNTGMIVLGAAGGAALLAAVAIGIGVAVTSGGDEGGKKGKKQGSINMAQVAQGVMAQPAIRYKGSLSGNGNVSGSITVTRNGMTTGDVTVDSAKVKLLTIDGTTYVKANDKFWGDQGEPSEQAKVFGGRWTKPPVDLDKLDFSKILSPSAIAAQLRQIGTVPATSQKTPSGTDAVRVATSGGTYYLTPKAPHSIVRIEQTGNATYSVDATAVAQTETSSVFTRLRGDVKALNGAMDPELNLIRSGYARGSGCNASGCTVKATFKLSSDSGESKVTARMTALISTKRSGGRTLGTCTDTGSVSAGKSVGLSCRVTSGTWRKFARSAIYGSGQTKFWTGAEALAQVVSSGDVSKLNDKIDEEERGS